MSGDGSGPARSAEAMLRNTPDLSDAKIAKRSGLSRSGVKVLRRQILGDVAHRRRKTHDELRAAPTRNANHLKRREIDRSNRALARCRDEAERLIPEHVAKLIDELMAKL